MSKEKISKIVLIGAGKLATNFALAARKKGYSILQVCNRSERNGRKLAALISSAYIGNLDDLTEKADLYALAVSDSAIRDLAGRIRLNDQLLIHFSGTADMDVLSGSSLNYGVLYPPQTFTKRSRTGFLNIPLCIEGNNQTSEKRLMAFSETLTNKVFQVNSYQRKIIHLSAIFAGNFTNFMYAVAEDLLTENDLPMDLIKPIIRKTASNARHRNIFGLQTGPAIREDLATLETHLEFLTDKPGFRDIYSIISENIIKLKHQNDEL